jgi:hypothetical protein
MPVLSWSPTNGANPAAFLSNLSAAMISGSRPEMDVGMFQDIFNASSPRVKGSFNARTRIREQFMFYVQRSRERSQDAEVH